MRPEPRTERIPTAVICQWTCRVDTSKEIEMNVEHLRGLEEIKEKLKTEVNRLSKEVSSFEKAVTSSEQTQVGKANHTH